MTRLMRPATTHLVATYSESIVFGGHFYCFNVMKETLRGIIFEHYLGRDVTNTEHVKAPVLLMKAVCSLTARYSSGITEGSFLRFSLRFGTEEEIKDLTLPMDDDALAFLLLTVFNLDQLTPELPVDSEEVVWQKTTEFENDFAFACGAVDEVVTKRGNELESYLRSAEEFFDEECSFVERKLRASVDEEDHGFVPVQIRCLCGTHEKYHPRMSSRIRRL